MVSVFHFRDTYIVQYMYIRKCCLSHRFKDRNYMALLIDREKVFDKKSISIKSVGEARYGGSIYQHIKGHVQQTYSQHHAKEINF